MTVQSGKKLNWLEHELPEGLLVDAAWLEANGYSRSLRSQYVAAGWLEQPTLSRLLAVSSNLTGSPKIEISFTNTPGFIIGLE